MMVAPRAPLFPLVAQSSADGSEVTVAFGYWKDDKPVVRFARAFPPTFTDADVQEALADFQTLADRVDTLSDGWKPRVIGNVTAGNFGGLPRIN